MCLEIWRVVWGFGWLDGSVGVVLRSLEAFLVWPWAV